MNTNHPKTIFRKTPSRACNPHFYTLLQEKNTAPVSFYPYSGGTRPLTGGIQFRRHPDENNRPKPGTLGYIATKVPGGEQVLLSCEHVLIFRRQDDRLVFQPDYSKCTGIYYNEVGNVADGIVGNHPISGGVDLFFIDAAYASVKNGISTRRFIPNVGDITGSESIINASTNPPIRIKKMGAATGFTEGDITEVGFNLGLAMKLIKIEPVAGKTFTYTVRRKIDPAIVSQVLVDFPNQAFQGTATLVDAAENIVEFQSEVFAIPGDSGALLVKAGGKVVGMIVGGDMFEARAFDPDAKRWRITGIPKGPAYACHIQPVLDNLGLRIDPSSGATSGKAIAVPGNLVTSEDPDRYTRLSEKLEQLEKEFQTTEQGRELLYFIRSSFQEVVRLVHHTRPAKVVWHRHNGPAFAASFFRCIAQPNLPFPREINGIPALTLLERMDQVLSETGSSALNEAFRQYREMVYHFFQSSKTINELLGHLKTKYATQ